MIVAPTLICLVFSWIDTKGGSHALSLFVAAIERSGVYMCLIQCYASENIMQNLDTKKKVLACSS